VPPLPFDPELTRPVETPTDPITGDPLDCTRCGACCHAGQGNILLSADDLVRWRRQGFHHLADHTDEGHFGERAFPVDERGACIHLDTTGGATLCRIYPHRAEVCRSFQAGSWQCLEFRRDHGLSPRS
jgi:Fe-S-cluster containining protein